MWFFRPMPTSQNQKFCSALSHKSTTHKYKHCFVEEMAQLIAKEEGVELSMPSLATCHAAFVFVLRSACQSPEQERRKQSFKQES